MRTVKQPASRDEPLVEYDAPGNRTWLHADERGTNAVAINIYYEYGAPGAGNSGRYGYTGQMWLPEIGLHYYRARMYDPKLGRFLQTDPIGYEGGINLYAYVGGDPVNFIDPTGTDIVVNGKRPPFCDRTSNIGSDFCNGTPNAVNSDFADDGWDVGGGGGGGIEDLTPGQRLRQCQASIDIATLMAVVYGAAFNTSLERKALKQFFLGRTSSLRLSSNVLAIATKFTAGGTQNIDRRNFPRSAPYDPAGSFRRIVNFGNANGGDQLDGLLGSATVIFDSSGKAVGLEDNFDFNDRPGLDRGPRAAFKHLRDLQARNCGASTKGFPIRAGSGR